MPVTGIYGSNGKPAEILLVDDNPGDAELTMEALQEGRWVNNISVAKDGMEAIAFLNHAEGFQSAPTPDLILLDLNLPKKNGFEVLQEIRQNPRLARIPVVILSSSQAERDVLRGYDLHANCFVSKPVDLEELLNVVKSIGAFWLAIVKLPPAPPGADGVRPL
jgi:chemotaxis family two-component system response regulator Rcp1